MAAIPLDVNEHTHRRFNPLSGEWVKVSPHRTKRPWQGKMDPPDRAERPRFDPACYLCPGNPRVGGAPNPDYKHTFVFENDFAAILPSTPVATLDDGELFHAESEQGLCKVMCFSPRHDLTLARMTTDEIIEVVAAWTRQYQEIGALDYINHIVIFENRGEIMGSSNPHPHCQIWAENAIPDLPARELIRQADYFTRHSSSMLLDYAKAELAKQERVVVENQSFVVVVPFWAVWPYEVMVLPRGKLESLLDLNGGQQRDLADIMRRLCVRYDNLFQTSFPYSMGIHQLPTDGKPHPGAQFHMHYFPPLLRSASVRKFMVGYEMLGMPQRDMSAEQAAAKLRELSEIHYQDGT